MKKVAIVGFGFMGKTHYGAWRKAKGAKVVAVCDSNLAQLNSKVKGNIKGAADNSALPSSVKVWENIDEMLAAGGFDIVDVTLPTALHADTSIKALKAGYHVLCEKPMALDLANCDRMLAAARSSGRKLLVAHCVRFDPAYSYIRSAVRDGRFGRLVAAHFTRYIAPPKWSPKGCDWFFDEDRSGGVFLDAHIHDADFILGTFGMPDRLFSALHRGIYGFPDHTATTYFYGNAIITADSSFAAADSLVFDACARIFLENATIYAGTSYRKPLVVYPNEGKPFSPRISRATGYELETRYFLDMVEGRRPAEKILTAEDARRSIALVLLERESAATGKCLSPIDGNRPN